MVALVAAVTTAHAGDIILNNDFSDGKTHWLGDGDASDTGEGLVITLKPDKWTVVRQMFSTDAALLKLTLIYTLSSDCTLGKTGDEVVPPLTSEGLKQASALGYDTIDFGVAKNELFMALLLAPSGLHTKVHVRGDNFIYAFNPVYAESYCRSISVANPDGSQTFTAPFQTEGRFADGNLCLCFPPGAGTVTITHASLDPAPSDSDANAPSSDGN